MLLNSSNLASRYIRKVQMIYICVFVVLNLLNLLKIKKEIENPSPKKSSAFKGEKWTKYVGYSLQPQFLRHSLQQQFLARVSSGNVKKKEYEHNTWWKKNHFEIKCFIFNLYQIAFNVKKLFTNNVYFFMDEFLFKYATL